MKQQTLRRMLGYVRAYRGQLAHRKTFFSHGSFLPLLTGVLFRLILIIEQIELIKIFNL